MQNRFRDLRAEMSNHEFSLLDDERIALRCGIGIVSFFMAIALLLYSVQKPLTPILQEDSNGVQSYDLDYRPLPNSWILNMLVLVNASVAIAQFADIILSVRSQKGRGSGRTKGQGVGSREERESTNTPALIEENPGLWELLSQDYLDEMPEHLRRIYYLATIKFGANQDQGEAKLLTIEEVIFNTQGKMSRSQVIEAFEQLQILNYGIYSQDKFLVGDLEG